MRLVPALLGIFTVPLSYLTLRALDCRATTALLGSLFITFENGMITQSRHILLDSPLIFFTALTVFLWVGFCNEDRREPFTESWWVWLALTGLSLGAVVSCKWVGLFTIATIGLGTIKQLWDLLGDLRITPKLWMRHFMARALCLILLPILLYMWMFWIHFAILSNSGEGDGFMSSEFQHTLRGRGMQDTYAGTCCPLGGRTQLIGIQMWRLVLKLRSVTSTHREVICTLTPTTTPAEASVSILFDVAYHTSHMQHPEQQITLYPHRDSNNDWRIVNGTDQGNPYVDWDVEPVQYVTIGSRIKLRHIITEKSLHSHDYRPPVSDVDFQQEVSGYGMPDFVGDANDDWIVEIVKGDPSTLR